MLRLRHRRIYFLQAGILPYTLGVSLVVSAIVGSIIMLGYFHRLHDKRIEIRTKLIQNLRSAEQLALGGGGNEDFFKAMDLDLYGELSDSVRITRMPWGFYDRFRVQAFHGNFEQQSDFLVGHRPDSAMYSGLYLYDDRRPLSVVGSTRLSGTLLLPEAGVQSAFVDRMGYQNDSLFYGVKKVSSDTFPQITMDISDVWDELDRYPKIAWDSGYSVSRSFRTDSLITIRGRKIEIADTLTGCVFIEANEVDFLRTASVENILVRADVIRFESGFEGSGQFLATDSLLVKASVTFNYPSVLFLNNDDDVGTIVLEGSSRVEGVLGLTGDPNLYSQRVLSINDGAVVVGAVYCLGYLELHGKIEGHATVRKTLVRTSTAVYENYLLNAEIDGDAFPDVPVPNLWFASNRKLIQIWLN